MYYLVKIFSFSNFYILAGHSPSVQTETGRGDTAAEQLLQRHHTSEEEAERPHCVANRVGAVQPKPVNFSTG